MTDDARGEPRDDDRSDPDPVFVEHHRQLADAVPVRLLEHRSRRLAAADHEQEVGVVRIEGADAEVGEHVSDGAGERPAVGIVMKGHPEPGTPDVQAARVDHGSAREQRPQDVIDVGLELRYVGGGEAAQLLDVADAVEQS